MEDTLFTKIIKREIFAHILCEDTHCIVILDTFPVVDGQTLVISKQQVDYLFELDDKVYQHLFAVAKKVSRALDGTFETVRTCLVVEGLEIPHAHIKLYPITTPHLEIHGGKEASGETLARHAKTIKEHL